VALDLPPGIATLPCSLLMPCYPCVCLLATLPCSLLMPCYPCVCLLARLLLVCARVCYWCPEQNNANNTKQQTVPSFVCQKIFPKHTGMLYSMDHIRGEASAAASQPASHSPAQNTNHKTVPEGEKTHQRTSGSGDGAATSQRRLPTRLAAGAAASPGPGC
jgi:hypothetical protein